MVEEEVEIGAEDKGKGKGQGLSPNEVEEQQGLEAELLTLSGSLGAQRAARSMAKGKVREWEAEEGELRSVGEVECADWARGNAATVEQLESMVARLEDWVGRGRKVKEEVKEEVEEVVEEKVEAEVVEEKVEGTGMAWLRGF